MSRPTRLPKRLRFDALEAREVPATAVLVGDTLTITGTEHNDAITVRQSATALTVDGVTGSFPSTSVRFVRIDALGGDDTIHLDKLDQEVIKPAVILAGTGNDSVFSGRGADYIDGEAGDDRIFGGYGPDKIAGDIGADVLYGGAGNDLIAGGAGDDDIHGQFGVDHLWGGAGYDVVSGGGGVADHVYDDFAPADGTRVADSNYVFHRVRTGKIGAPEFGWFDAHLLDGPLRRQARLDARDGLLDRADMIALFEQPTDGSTVTATEFHDLDALVHSPEVGIAVQARYFGKKIIDGDPANQWFTGGDGTRAALGDLHAGDTDDHLQQLIDKWFLGKDEPMAKSDDRATTFGYREAAGKLFVGGPAATDLHQGDVGDCYWLAGLGAVARQDPQRIRNMFTDNGDGTYTVRLFHSGKAEYVTVDRRLPVDGHGKLVFANQGTAASNTGAELWVPLAEKAYAQFNESGWTGQDGTNSYNGVGGALAAGAENDGGINGGSSGTAMTQITAAAVTARAIPGTTFADVRAAFDAGKAVTFSSVDDPVRGDVVSNHAYVMVGYDATHHTVTLRNPWGANDSKPEQLTLSMSSVESNFDYWYAADV